MALGLPDDPAKQKKLLLGLVPLILAGAYWYAYHGGQAQEVEDMRTRLERLETRNAQARARAPQSQQLEERLEQFERHIVRLEQLVPRNEEVSQLLFQIHQQAERAGLDVARFTPGRTEPGQHYQRRIFEITVLGSYHDLGRFLADIGSLPRIITATNLRVTPNPGPGEAGRSRLEAAFRIETYVLPEPTRGAANDAEARTGA